MSNSQTPSKGGDVSIGRFGQSLGAGALCDPLKTGHPEGNLFPARPPGMNMLTVPGMEPAFRADLKSRGCTFYGAPGLFPGGSSRTGPAPFGALSGDGTIGYRYRHNPAFVPRALEGEKAEDRGCVVDPELLEAAKRCIDSYREDGPRIAFDFDELPDATKSGGKAPSATHKSDQADVEGGKTLPRPAPYAPNSWGFMFPPHLHGAHSMYHPRMWAPDGREHGFGYQNPARSGAKGVQNGASGSKTNPSPDGEPAKKVASGEWNAQSSGGEGTCSLLGRKHPLLMLPTKPNGVTDDAELEMQKLVMDKMSTLDASEQMSMLNSKNEGEDVQKLLGIQLPEFPMLGQSILPHPFQNIAGEEGVLGDLLMVWAFVHSFSDILGLWPCAIDELVAAFSGGQRSRLLGEVHIGLLRLLMAEMEEAHISGTEKVVSHIDKATLSSAHTLEEAWAWGYDVDIWRAHLNAVTWPEILRQFSIAAGLGPVRPKPKREARPKIGSEGEDVVQDASGAGLNLRMPSRFSPGSVKAAAWMVLSEAGPEGLTVQEIARRIQKKGLRDLSTSKTPEASVVGGLSRDVVFCRVAPATYALQSIISHHRQLLTSTRSQQKKEKKAAKNPAEQAGSQEVESGNGGKRNCPSKTPADATPESDQSRRASARGSAEGDDKSCKPLRQQSSEKESMGGGRRSTVNDTETNDICESESGQERSWIRRLLTEEYDELSVRERMDALCALCNMATDGPSVRSKLDSRQDEQQRLRKKAQEDTRAARHQTPANKGRELVEASQSSHRAEQDETKRKEPPYSQPRKKQTSTPNMRLEPLGSDRRHNRYWMFCDGSDASKGRIFLESFSNKSIQVIHDGNQLDDLKKVLEPRGARERALLNKINQSEEAIRGAMQRKESPTADETEDRIDGVKRRKMEDMPCKPNGSWTSNEWLDSVRPLAEQTVPRSSSCDVASLCRSSIQKSGSVSSGKLDLLVKFRRDLLRVEEAIPEEAYIDGAWSRSDWREKVFDASSPTELRSCLEQLEAAIGQGSMSPGFVRKPTLISGAWSEIDQDTGRTPGLSWLPCTMPSLFLRLLAIDAALIYKEGVPPGRETLHAYNYIQRPTAPGLVESIKSEPPPCNTSPSNGAATESPGCASGAPVRDASHGAPAAQQCENQTPEKDANCQ